jgi:thiol-disulfide isomerase/thioredoxin
MRLIRRAICGLALVLAACSTPPTSEPRATPESEASPSAVPSSAAASEAVGTPAASATDEPVAADPLLAVELMDVRSGETFTLAELSSEKPVLVEAMAVWCTTCLAQQREVVEAHGLADFHTVGIDVDPNERAADLAEYAEREGFDWHFAMADTSLVQMLTDRFGFGVTNPPSTPTFVITSAGDVRALEFGRVRSAEELVAELTTS